MVSKNKLDFWYKNGFNVLIKGRHGVGKSSVVTNFLDDREIDYMYFSCGTMDPWVDFVGVPKEKENEDGSSYLDLVRPKPLQEDNVEVMVFDEFNRAKSKVKNAVLELVQFKSINGKKFENLKAIWALINPADDVDFDYDVEPLAPAQKDRFHVQVEVPYRPDKKWFVEQFGDAGAGAVAWWKNLSDEKQRDVTPRRLEYALRMLILGGSIRDVFPEGINVSQFRKQVDVGDITKIFIQLEQKNSFEIERFFEDENNYFNTIDAIKKSKDLIRKYIRYMPEEKISNLVQSDHSVFKHVVRSRNDVQKFDNIFNSILKSEVCSEDFKEKLSKFNQALNGSDSIKVGDYTYVEPPESKIISRSIEDVDKEKKEIVDEYSSRLKAARNVMDSPSSNTNSRKIAIENLCDSYVKGVLNADHLVSTIKGVLDGFLDRSRTSTVQSFTPFAVLFNTCIKEITNEKRINIDQEKFLRDIFQNHNFSEYVDDCIEDNKELDLYIVVDR